MSPCSAQCAGWRSAGKVTPLGVVLCGGQVWGLLGMPVLSTSSIPACCAPVAPAHMQGVCGDEESLWPASDPVSDAGRNQEPEVPICMWVRFGTAKNAVPGAPEAEWLSPATLPSCREAKVGSVPDMGCTRVLTGELRTQHCHSNVSEAFFSSPLAALCLVLGCMIFPDGWDAETIRDMCGEKTGKYSLGDCSVRWAYILAIIGILNALILSFLAFVLGNRQNDLLHEELKTESKGEHRATGGSWVGTAWGAWPLWQPGKGPVGLTAPC